MPINVGLFLFLLIQQVNPILRLLMRRQPKATEKMVAIPMPTVSNEQSFLLHQRLMMITELLSILQIEFGSTELRRCSFYYQDGLIIGQAKDQLQSAIDLIIQLITMLIKQYCGTGQKSKGFTISALIYLLSLLTFSSLIIQTFFSYTPILGLVYTQLKTGQKDMVFKPLKDNRLNSSRFSQGLDLNIIGRINEQFTINNKARISGQFIDVSKYSQFNKQAKFNQSIDQIYLSSYGDIEIEDKGQVSLPVRTYLSLILQAIDRYSLSDQQKNRLSADLNLLITNNLTISGEVNFIKIGPQILNKLKIEYGADYYIFMDISTSFQYLFKQSWKNLVKTYNISQLLLSVIESRSFSLSHFTKQIIGNLPNRFEVYRTSNQQEIRKKITGYLNIAANIFGISCYESQSPITNNLYAIKQVNIILQLIFNLIIFLFLALSYTALDSTMYIKMQLQKKDIIILRLLGASNLQISIRLMKKILSVIVISNIIGITTSILFLSGLSLSISKIIGQEFTFSYDESTVFSVVLVGFVFPVFIAYLYAYTGLKDIKVANLGEGQQQVQESRAQVYVQNQKLPLQKFILALVGTVYGFLIYFILPSVFMNGNTQIMSIAFIVFICGIVIGAIRLLDIFEYFLQGMIAKILLYRMDKFIMNLIVKNLSINRIQNRKISLVYMISTIVLATLSLNAQFQIKGSIRQIFNFRGGHIVIYMNFKPQFYNRLLSQLPGVNSYSFITRPYSDYFQKDRIKTLASDMTKNKYYQTVLYGVAGPFFPSQQKWRSSATYTQAEESYSFFGWLSTERGYNTAVVGEAMVRQLEIRSSIDKKFLINIIRNGTMIRYPLRISTINTKHLNLYFSYRSDATSVVGINIDVFKDLVAIPDHQFHFGKVVIQLQDLKFTQTVLEQIKKAINQNKIQQKYDEQPEIWNLQSQINSLQNLMIISKHSIKIILILFSIICFSSLSSTNYISVQNQARSIGILLSLGLQEIKIRKIYKYETFILLVCSSIKSIIISHFLSLIIVWQRDLFSNSDPENIAQIDTYIFVILIAAISSYFSSNRALDELFTKTISQMIKRKD